MKMRKFRPFDKRALCYENSGILKKLREEHQLNEDEACGIHIESDEERQRVLEAAGWKFVRIKYADWIDEKFDRDTVVSAIVDLLK